MSENTGVMPSEVAAAVRAEVQGHPDTLTQAWGQTVGLTYGTARFYMTSRKFRWTSRLIMFPAVFIIFPVPVVGTALILFVIWRSVRLAQKLATRLETRKVTKARERAEQAAQVQEVTAPVKARKRRIRFEISIG